MNSFFVYIDTLDKFLSKKISVNETNTKYITGLLDGEEISCSPSEVDITWTQLVFIKSLQKIWTHGKFYNNSEKETEEEKKAITDYYTNQYLTFVAKENGTFTFTPQNNNVISYSTDGGSNWSTYEDGVEVKSGDKVMWKGMMTPATNKGIGSFSASTNSFDVQGNAMSLLQGDNFKWQTDLSGKDYAFYRLFKGTKVVNAKNLSLPATTLATKCYNNMFGGCTSLTSAPELPATTLAESCYQSMFNGCTSLTSAPELPATTLANNCYYSMFNICTSLVTAPELPATTLVQSCYSYMFNGCTSLVTAPELPATTLASYCYNNMFGGCTSLTSAPELPATTLANNCYQSMFNGCTSLVTAPELPATTLVQSCYSYMFNGCTSLVTALELPATTLASYCYNGMFYDCTSLVTAPDLSATTLAQGCYQYMFQGCTSLKTAPSILPATTLTTQCYNSMFNGCSSLNNITCLATDISATDCTGNWVDGVAASGTFIKADNMSDWTTGVNGIPSGWATHTETDEELVHKYELDQKTSKTINKTWSELKSLRDNSQLVPGQWYRITDYITTTAQANTQSANHAFDIIVRADDTDVLNENAYAIQHSGDTYFSASTLEAWELKYCLDNDTTRFAWADDTNGKGVIYYMKDEFENECPYDFKNIQFKRYQLKNQNSLHIADYPMGESNYSGAIQMAFNIWKEKLGTSMSSNNVAFYYTKGVYSDGYLVNGAEIYDYSNDYESYDNGNLMFDETTSEGNYIGVVSVYDYFDVIAEVENTNGEWFYTFSKKATTSATATDASMDTDCYENFIKEYFDNGTQTLNDNIFIVVSNSIVVYGNSFDTNCYNNTFGNNCNYNSFGNYFQYNSFGNYCGSNTFGNSCYRNTFGNYCYCNTFGNECYNNSFGNICYRNTFGNGCGSNMFGNNCYSNSFGNECYYNTFGNSCYRNTFGNYCCSNSFGNGCGSNTFGNNCNHITFAKDYMYYNIVENGNQYITVTSTQTTSGSNVIRNFTIAQGVNNTTTNKTISHNTVNDTFQTIYQPANSQTISV